MADTAAGSVQIGSTTLTAASGGLTAFASALRLRNIAGTANGLIQFGASGPTISSGSGTPEGVVTAPVGSLYTNATGGAGTTLYVKQSGAGSTGWVAK